MKISIFKSKKEVDLVKLIDSRALICANSGGGKSYAVRKLLEETNDKVMSIVLDVEGEFKTLREKFDYLLIGEKGDVPLNMKSAKLLPEKLLELNVSTIIDISDLKMHERVKYARDFLEALMQLPREKNGVNYWKPCIVILDEAHLLAGQQEKQDSTHAVIDLMTRGRKRGFCGVLCSQRISKLHKDAVAEANNYMVGRTGLDIDMKRASEILGFTSREQMLSLRDLEPGEFYVFGPALTKHVEKEFIEQVKTTHPKVGMDVKNKIVQPTDKVKAILNKISSLPKEVEEKVKNLEDYKKKINELKNEVYVLKKKHTKKEISMEDYTTINQLRQSIKQYESIINWYKKDWEIINSHYQKFLARQIQNPINPSGVGVQPMPIGEQQTKKVQPRDAYSNDGSLVRDKTGENSYGRCEKMIYSFLYHNQGKSYTKTQIGAVTGYSATSGGFNNAISKLRASQLIMQENDRISLKELDDSLVITDNFKKENIRNILGKCEKEILDVMLEVQETTREELANQTQTRYSYTSGGFNNSLSRLRTLGIITKNGETIKLTEEFLDL